MVGVTSFAQNFGALNGYFLDNYSKEEIVGAHVFIKQDGITYQTLTFTDGSFFIDSIPSGSYVLHFRYLGDTIKLSPVVIEKDLITEIGNVYTNYSFSHCPIIIKSTTCYFPAYWYEWFFEIILQEDFVRSPTRFDTKELIAGKTSEVRLIDDELIFRGARKDGLLYMIDGVKVIGESRLPSASIEGIRFYTSGLPAKYGDTLGGAIIIETKGYFDLYQE